MMRLNQKVFPILSAVAIATAVVAGASQVRAESRWDGLETNRFDTNFFDFRTVTAMPSSLEDRGIETNFNSDATPGIDHSPRNFYDRPRNVFETGGKDR